MDNQTQKQSNRARSSHHRYRGFVDDYKRGRLDHDDAGENQKREGDGESSSPESRRLKRREYVRAYLRWLKPYRFAIGGLFLLALIVAGMEMIEPLFMRFIIDKVLLNYTLDTSARLMRLNLAGVLFVSVIVLSRCIGVIKDYRQRLVNVHVMLSLR